LLQVYDRMINSASQVTLVVLTLVLLVAFSALAGLDLVRARVLTRGSVRLDRLLAGRVLAAAGRKASATTVVIGPRVLRACESGSRLEDPNVLGMSGLVSLLTVGAAGRGGESFLAASGMSTGRGEKSAGNFPRG
jgi:hypothetical protein